MKKIIQYTLFILARSVLAAYRPDIVGITGSVGKTTAKEAIRIVLSSHFSVRAAFGNLNTEIGLPLAIFGVQENPGKSLIGWLRVFYRALRLLLIKDASYPRVLILEYAADHPGDISYLTKLCPARIGVLTSISSAHIGGFGSIESIANEKMQLLTNLTGSSPHAIVNGDDEEITRRMARISVPVMRYGCERGNAIAADAIEENHFFKPGKQTHLRISATVRRGHETASLHLEECVAQHMVSAALAGIAVGTIFGISLKESCELLRQFRPFRGRMRLIEGINETLIIDDSYNSSPIAVRSALAALSSFQILPAARRIAVLGDMAELGDFTAESHREIGSLCFSSRVDVLVTVGPLSNETAHAAQNHGMSEQSIHAFDDAHSAAQFVKGLLKKGDVVLVKGSQMMRLEKMVREIMQSPEIAGNILVRQGKEWV